MVNRRDADRRGIEWADCCKTGFDGLEAWDAEFFGCFSKSNRGAVDHRDEFDRLPSLLKLMENTEMVTPECSRSDDCDAQWL